jgi:hypothetical protein
MHPVAARTAAVRGDDRRFHVVYELLLTNAKRVPATIERIEVLDADNRARVLRTLAGADLAATTMHLSGRPAADRVLGQDQSHIVFIELSFDRGSDVPARLVHRLTGTGAAGPAATEPSPISYLAAVYPLDRFTPPVLGPPLRGTGWVAVNGCCLRAGPHRSALQTVNGGLHNSQRFAIDWQKLDDRGRFVVGDPSVLENWVSYGEQVFAVADGVVVATRDDLDDQPPGQLPDPATITVQTVNGNHVVLRLAQGIYVFYAHLRQGTVSVAVGDRVRAGQLLGRLGNSGNTSAPHLHLQVMSAASTLGSNGLPYVHRAFRLTGFIDPARWEAAPDQTGTWGTRPTFAAQRRFQQLPLDLHIIDWLDDR